MPDVPPTWRLLVAYARMRFLPECSFGWFVLAPLED